MSEKKSRTVQTRKPGTRYTQAEIDKGLTLIAHCAGSAQHASEMSGIPMQTLYDWKTKHHVELYRQIQEREGPKLEALAVNQAREIIVQAAELEKDLITQLAEQRYNLKAGEIAGALRNVTTTRGISVDKVLQLTGRPTVVTEHRSGDDILRSLKTKLPGLIVNGTAEELAPVPALTEHGGAANAHEPSSSGAVQTDA
jgi:hypothetical protein